MDLLYLDLLPELRAIIRSILADVRLRLAIKITCTLLYSEDHDYGAVMRVLKEESRLVEVFPRLFLQFALDWLSEDMRQPILYTPRWSIHDHFGKEAGFMDVCKIDDTGTEQWASVWCDLESSLWSLHVSVHTFPETWQETEVFSVMWTSLTEIRSRLKIARQTMDIKFVF